jgi:hypothetical protein
MIQKTNPRHASTSVVPARQAASDSPEHWGQWSGRKHYSLEVVQHPLRARMCGFGDKDRRPLAPAAVAKMIVRREDNSLVDVDEVDCSFFLVTVDLWSADGKHEMNLVLHPSSADRYVPTNTVAKPRRRGTSSTTPRSGHPTPVIPHITPNNTHHSARPATEPNCDLQTGIPSVPGYAPGYPFPPPLQESNNYHHPPPYGPSPSEQPTWGYAAQGPTADRNTGFPPPVLPSIHSFGSNNAAPTTSNAINVTAPPVNESWSQDSSGREQSDMTTYRPWHADGSYPLESAPNQHVYNAPAVDPSLRGVPPSPSNPDTRDGSWSQPAPDATVPQPRYSQDTYPHAGSNAQFDGSIYGAANYANPPPASYYSGPYVQSAHDAPPPPPPPPPLSNIPPLPRHTYTRTLVGPLSANACRLLDEHRKPGIFYLFQDLSVRTEGIPICSFISRLLPNPFTQALSVYGCVS